MTVHESRPKSETTIFINEFYGADAVRYIQDNDNVFAKKVWNGRYYDYWVRAAVTGPDVPHLINPWGMNFTEGDQARHEKSMGKRRYEYKKVPQEAFEMFVSFLETRQERQYRAAERLLD